MTCPITIGVIEKDINLLTEDDVYISEMLTPSNTGRMYLNVLEL